MPNVTVMIVGGKAQENLVAVTVGNRRWGANGAAWETGQNVVPGNDTEIRAYYSGGPGGGSVIAYYNLDDADVTVEITADGPNNTPVEIIDD